MMWHLPLEPRSPDTQLGTYAISPASGAETESTAWVPSRVPLSGVQATRVGPTREEGGGQSRKEEPTPTGRDGLGHGEARDSSKLRDTRPQSREGRCGCSASA